jgi:hypothetical protein
MLHDLQRHHAVGQQLQRPTRPALGPGTAGDGDQLGFFLPIEHLLNAGTDLLAALQRRIQPLFDEPLAKIFNRTDAGVERLGGVRVPHSRTRLRVVNRKQDVGVTNAIRRRLPDTHQLLQPFPFLGFQPNDVLLHADPP